MLKSELVRQLCERFDDNIIDEPTSSPVWESLPVGGKPLPIVFGVDGSLQVVTSEVPPHMALAFVKTALLAVDQYALSRLDKDAPHPFALRDILSKSAQFHATVFPLRHVSVPGMRISCGGTPPSWRRNLSQAIAPAAGVNKRKRGRELGAALTPPDACGRLAPPLFWRCHTGGRGARGGAE